MSGLKARFVVPPLPEREASHPAARLNPIFEIQRQQVVMATQVAAALWDFRRRDMDRAWLMRARCQSPS
jgi:hypothetical protein